MKYVFLGTGSILAILFMIQMKRGKKYTSIVETLDGNAFPLFELYIVGFSWSSGKIFSLGKKRYAELKAQAAMLYEQQYADYYANVVWAQMLTLVHLFLAFTFLMTGAMYKSSTLILTVGIFLSVLMGVYCMQNMKNMVSERRTECESQLPEVVSTMAVLVNSGMMLREAWSMVAENGAGAFYKLMQQAMENMRNGYSDMDAISLFGKTSHSTEIKKFTSALIQSMEKGGGELGGFLAQQSSELWNSKRQRMLQRGEKAATKLLLPIVLIFVGIIIIVMTAAFAGSLF